MIGCGRLTIMGHGDNARCGDRFWGGDSFECDQCKIARLTEALEKIDDCSAGGNPNRWFRVIAHEALQGK